VSERSVRSGGDLLVEAEMLLNRGNALKGGMGFLQASHLYTSICEGVYHGGPRRHECADGLDVMHH
jgi:hypothetical protein